MSSGVRRIRRLRIVGDAICREEDAGMVVSSRWRMGRGEEEAEGIGEYAIGEEMVVEEYE